MNAPPRSADAHVRSTPPRTWASRLHRSIRLAFDAVAADVRRRTTAAPVESASSPRWLLGGRLRAFLRGCQTLVIRPPASLPRQHRRRTIAFLDLP